MDALIEGKLKDYLVNRFKYRPVQVGAILTQIDSLAAMSGFAVDENFARAGMGAGPEARVASGIVDRALGGGGGETTDYEIKMEMERWLRTQKAVVRGV